MDDIETIEGDIGEFWGDSKEEKVTSFNFSVMENLVQLEFIRKMVIHVAKETRISTALVRVGALLVPVIFAFSCVLDRPPTERSD